MTQLPLPELLHCSLPDFPALGGIVRRDLKPVNVFLACVVYTLAGPIDVRAASPQGQLEARRGGELVTLDATETWVARETLTRLASTRAA